MCLQLDRLAHQDLMGHQDHLEWQEVSVLLDPQVGQVLQAIQVHLDHSALLDFQVINHNN